MRKILISVLVLFFVACSGETDPTSPNSDTPPTPPYEAKGGLANDYRSQDGSIQIIHDVVWVGGKAKETDCRISPDRVYLWFSAKDPYGSGGWMTLHGYYDGDGEYVFDKTWNGETVKLRFYRM